MTVLIVAPRRCSYLSGNLSEFLRLGKFKSKAALSRQATGGET
jgi:hypothetical protein